MCDGNGFSVPGGLAPSHLFHDQWYPRVRGSPRSAPVADSLPRENPPFVTFVLCNLKHRLPLLSFFIYSHSFRVSRPHFLVLGFSTTPRGLKFSKPGRSTVATASVFPPLRLTTETKFDLHSPARLEYLKPNSGNK
jgi:hypothetical protein